MVKVPANPCARTPPVSIVALGAAFVRFGSVVQCGTVAAALELAGAVYRECQGVLGSR